MNERFGIDTLIEGAKSGELSRRDILKGSIALGMGLPFGMALVNAGSVGAQDAMTLSFDAAPRKAVAASRTLRQPRTATSLSAAASSRSIAWRFPWSPSRLTCDMVGDLAESWEIADTTATFKLVQNATWHDGTPLTAKDVVFTINMLTDPATTSRWDRRSATSRATRKRRPRRRPARPRCQA